MPERDPLDVPQTSAGDHAYAVVKGVVSTIPVVGPTIAEVFASFVVPPLERRRNEWMEDIVERLYELEKGQQVNFDNLRDNPEFLDTLLKASREAICTGNIDKRQALRNAVLNSAMPCPPSAAKQTMFLSWVGEMTEWHIRLVPQPVSRTQVCSHAAS